MKEAESDRPRPEMKEEEQRRAGVVEAQGDSQAAGSSRSAAGAGELRQQIQGLLPGLLTQRWTVSITGSASFAVCPAEK